MKPSFDLVCLPLALILGLATVGCDGETPTPASTTTPDPGVPPVGDANTNPTVTGSVTFSGTTTTITVVHDGTLGGIASGNKYEVRILQGSGFTDKKPMPDKFFQVGAAELNKSPSDAAIGTVMRTGAVDTDANFYYIAVDTFEYTPASSCKTPKGRHMFVRIYTKDYSSGAWTTNDVTEAAKTIIEIK